MPKCRIPQLFGEMALSGCGRRWLRLVELGNYANPFWIRPCTRFLIAIGSFVGFIVAYNTYGRWIARQVFGLDPHAGVPSKQLEDGVDYVPSKRSIVFGHHFTSIAGTGPIVGPAIAVFWGWLPALLWVVLGSIFHWRRSRFWRVGGEHAQSGPNRRRGRRASDFAANQTAFPAGPVFSP